MACGWGVATRAEGNTLYEGMWENDLWNGYGKCLDQERVKTELINQIFRNILLCWRRKMGRLKKGWIRKWQNNYLLVSKKSIS